MERMDQVLAYEQYLRDEILEATGGGDPLRAEPRSLGCRLRTGTESQRLLKAWSLDVFRGYASFSFPISSAHCVNRAFICG